MVILLKVTGMAHLWRIVLVSRVFVGSNGAIQLHIQRSGPKKKKIVAPGKKASVKVFCQL
jgi:hypothetical protein